MAVQNRLALTDSLVLLDLWTHLDGVLLSGYFPIHCKIKTLCASMWIYYSYSYACCSIKVYPTLYNSHHSTKLNREQDYLLPTWARKITCQMFRLNASVVIMAKVKEVRTALLFIAMHYWGYTSLEVKGQWGLLLPPHHSNPATRDFQSSVSVEALLKVQSYTGKYHKFVAVCIVTDAQHV